MVNFEFKILSHLGKFLRKPQGINFLTHPYVWMVDIDSMGFYTGMRSQHAIGHVVTYMPNRSAVE